MSKAFRAVEQRIGSPRPGIFDRRKHFCCMDIVTGNKLSDGAIVISVRLGNQG
jgi:hypothetical protein